MCDHSPVCLSLPILSEVQKWRAETFAVGTDPMWEASNSCLSDPEPSILEYTSQWLRLILEGQEVHL